MRHHQLIVFAALAFGFSGGVLAAAGPSDSPRVSVSEALRGVRVFPNPWRSDIHPHEFITFDRLPTGSTVKIFTLAGHLVKTLDVPANEVHWDRTNSAGDLVASGVYLYVVKDNHGSETTGKIAIIR
jgi:hypothetical protein